MKTVTPKTISEPDAIQVENRKALPSQSQPASDGKSDISGRSWPPVGKAQQRKKTFLACSPVFASQGIDLV